MHLLKPSHTLAAAAGLFWIAWLLMPGVGVIDPEEIFGLVSARRGCVAASVIIQLLSAVLYVPAMIGLLTKTELGTRPALRTAATLLLVGAMGSAADAVLHLLAFAMTAPGVETQAMVPTMAFMQGPGLALLAPILLAFFVGGGRLSYVLANAGLLPTHAAHVHWLAPLIAAVGGMCAARGWLPARAVGLTTLGIVSGAQIWAAIALELVQDRDHAPRSLIASTHGR